MYELLDILLSTHEQLLQNIQARFSKKKAELTVTSLTASSYIP